MIKREWPMIRRYWKRVGGTLVKEFPVVERGPGHSGRWIDAVIVKGGARETKKASEIDVKGRDVIVVQAKARTLGMYVMGQTFFSAQLVKERFKPRRVEGVALVKDDDRVLRRVFEKYPGMKVVLDRRQM